MKFIPIASSSSGNCYRVLGSNSQILIEAGIPFKEIQKALDFRVSGLSGVLISHEHQDHAKAVLDMLRHGVDVYLSHGTKQALGLDHHRLKVIQPGKKFKIGEFLVFPFEVQHDAKEPLGFLILDKKDKLLFATDTYYIRYVFKGLTIIAVECNYSEEILRENIINGITPVEMKKRLIKSHFSLENYVEFLKANDLSSVREIWLIHMSDRNSDSEMFKEKIQALTGKPVYTPI